MENQVIVISWDQVERANQWTKCELASPKVWLVKGAGILVESVHKEQRLSMKGIKWE